MVMRTRYRLATVLVLIALAVVTAACGPASAPTTGASGPTSTAGPNTSAEPVVSGDPAVWVLGPRQSLHRSSTTFTALVWRLGCNNGTTGQVLPPRVQLGESEIVVTFAVAPKQQDPAPCPGNDQVSFEVDLGEPLQGRTLVDGQCVGGRAASNGFCADGATRFTP
ncbi:hypothetical protein GCM10022225_30280 [Plantactinospora mayteni]|uniref:Uncharacterized protein n=1 Tax=Plantactinospora mayteni TaxID=566021 RepID=A0ABQ4EVH4_9ACTN|nr:hypothetical protein [Plantactinospora mayteni]GIG98664.1 hypothetical protein Pma05_52370 [Plantactinospora mayteni]